MPRQAATGRSRHAGSRSPGAGSADRRPSAPGCLTPTPAGTLGIGPGRVDRHETEFQSRSPRPAVYGRVRNHAQRWPPTVATRGSLCFSSPEPDNIVVPHRLCPELPHVAGADLEISTLTETAASWLRDGRSAAPRPLSLVTESRL